MDTVHFVDTTIRDGHQSLWAENMTTGMMLPIARDLDDGGYEGIELIAGSHLKKTVRELKEDPWERVRLVAKKITRTPLRVISGPVNSFEYNPPSMFRLFMERMAAHGIRPVGCVMRTTGIAESPPSRRPDSENVRPTHTRVGNAAWCAITVTLCARE